MRTKASALLGQRRTSPIELPEQMTPAESVCRARAAGEVDRTDVFWIEALEILDLIEVKVQAVRVDVVQIEQ